MIVKICGARTKKDFLSAIKAGADEIGFIVGVPESKRNISFKKARGLLRIKITKRRIAVTVAKSAEEIEELASEINPKTIQVHGNIPKQEWKKILAFCKRKKIEIIRAVKAGLGAENEIKNCGVDAILLDSAAVGGTGKTADWKRCAQIVKKFTDKRIKLSGGLTPENVQEAIRTVKPWAVDVSSGVEEDGKKSFRKMRKFVKTAKSLGGARAPSSCSGP